MGIWQASDFSLSKDHHDDHQQPGHKQQLFLNQHFATWFTPITTCECKIFGAKRFHAEWGSQLAVKRPLELEPFISFSNPDKERFFSRHFHKFFLLPNVNIVITYERSQENRTDCHGKANTLRLCSHMLNFSIMSNLGVEIFLKKIFLFFYA